MRRLKFNNRQDLLNNADVGDILEYKKGGVWYKGVILTVDPMKILIFFDLAKYLEGRYWKPILSPGTNYFVLVKS